MIANKIKRCKTDSFPGCVPPIFHFFLFRFMMISLLFFIDVVHLSGLQIYFRKFYDIKFHNFLISSNTDFLTCRLEFDNPDRPECQNLLSIYQLVSGKSKEVLSLSLCVGAFLPLNALCLFLLKNIFLRHDIYDTLPIDHFRLFPPFNKNRPPFYVLSDPTFSGYCFAGSCFRMSEHELGHIQAHYY